MPMYRFEIVDGVRLSDPAGLQCDDRHDAKEKAKIIATQIASELEGRPGAGRRARDAPSRVRERERRPPSRRVRLWFPIARR